MVIDEMKAGGRVVTKLLPGFWHESLVNLVWVWRKLEERQVWGKVMGSLCMKLGK